MSEVNKPKDVVGRPSKYTEEACTKVFDHLASGGSLAASAGKAGVHKDTLFEWCKVHPEFSDLIKQGKSLGMAVWEQRLVMQAIENPGNTAAIIFAMKNIYRDDWRDRVVNEVVGRDDGPIETTEVPAAERLKGMLDGVSERS